MIDIEHQLEVVENLSSQTTDSLDRRKQLLDALKNTAEYFSLHNATTRVQDVLEHISNAITQLLNACGDISTDVRVAADDCLKKVIKMRVHVHSDKIIDSLVKGMTKPNKNSQRAALIHFGSICNYILPQKCRTFVQLLIPIFMQLSNNNVEPIVLVCNHFDCYP
jgi:hypothetical protein